jgi:hypothetical protein
MNKRIKDIKRDYYKKYEILFPGDANVISELWDNWEEENFTRPNVDDIVANSVKRDEQFFREIVKIAEKIVEKDLSNIEFCPFILDDYNFSALSAIDGYLVFTDESFSRMLFFFSVVFMFDVYNFIQDEEKDNIMSLLNDAIDNYFNYRTFIPNESIIFSLVKKDYETTEFASYFYNSIRIFMFAHEISHHILGHTKGTIKKNMKANGQSIEMETDKRDKLCEFDADVLGYKIFLEVMNTTDNSIDVTYCKYRFEFAPLFLFDLFEKLDELKGKKEYDTHPAPIERKKNLLKHYKIEDTGSLYNDLLEVMRNKVKTTIF